MSAVRSPRPTNTLRQRNGEGCGEGGRQHRGRDWRLRMGAAVVDQLVDRLESIGASQHLAAQEAKLGALRKVAFHDAAEALVRSTWPPTASARTRAARLTVCP